MSVTSHVLDAGTGTPARGVAVRWERRAGDVWQQVGQAATDADGRVAQWASQSSVEPLTAGVHRLVFGSGDYFAARGVTTFYPEVVVVFEIVDEAAHHHVPLLLSPFAYSTYRGS